MSNKPNYKKMDRKAQEMQVSSLVSFAVLFIIIAIAFGLSADILNSVRSTQDNDYGTLLANESITWGGNNTAISLSRDNIVGGTFILYNNGSGVAQGGTIGNWTLNTTLGLLYITNNSPGGGDNWGGAESLNGNGEIVTNALNATFSYYIGSYSRNITGYGISSQVTLVKWMPTIALLIIIVILIGILLFYLGRKVLGGGQGE